MKNPIITELRRIRDGRAKQYSYRIDEMARDLTDLEPWMEKKTYTLRNGRLVSVAALRHERRSQPGALKTRAPKRK